MLMVISSVIIAIMLFLCAYLGYREGLRLGMQTSKGVEPAKIRSPVEVVKNIVKEVNQTKQEHEQAKLEKKYAEDLEKLLNYTGDVEDEE